MKKRLVVLIIVLCLTAVVAFLIIRMNSLSLKNYPVRGVDVSHHQGEIDWQKISAQNICFAYIKATEGGDFKDSNFSDNWNNAIKAGLRVGAYHFFTAKTDAKLQADNFIQSVPKTKNMLPPAIDVEIDPVANAEEKQVIENRLEDLLQRIEAHYGIKPLIYTDDERYNLYIAGRFSGYSLWYRSIFKKPVLPNGHKWVFWQYNPVGRLHGYKGHEFFIDLNVFNGTNEMFESFPVGLQHD